MAEGEISQGDFYVKTAEVPGLILQSAVFKIYGHITQSLSGLAQNFLEADLLPVDPLLSHNVWINFRGAGLLPMRATYEPLVKLSA